MKKTMNDIKKRYKDVTEELSEIDLKNHIRVSKCEVITDSLKFVTMCSCTIETLMEVGRPNIATIESYLEPLEKFVHLHK